MKQTPYERWLVFYENEKEEVKWFFWRMIESYAFMWSVIFIMLVCFWVGLFSIVGIIKAHAETIDLKASYYSAESLKKEGTWKNGETKMANGKRFDEKDFTCASRDFNLGTLLRITNKENGKQTICKVTDRTAKRFKGKRIDLSKGAFIKIADLKQGLVLVKVEVVNE